MFFFYQELNFVREAGEGMDLGYLAIMKHSKKIKVLNAVACELGFWSFLPNSICKTCARPKLTRLSSSCSPNISLNQLVI